MKLTTYTNLVPKLRMRGAVPHSAHTYARRCASVRTRDSFYFNQKRRIRVRTACGVRCTTRWALFTAMQWPVCGTHVFVYLRLIDANYTTGVLRRRRGNPHVGLRRLCPAVSCPLYGGNPHDGLQRLCPAVSCPPCMES